MRPPTLTELERVCRVESGRTASVRIPLPDPDGDLVVFVRVITAAERDTLELAVARGGLPRAELVARALADGVGAFRLLADEDVYTVALWPGWIVDRLFDAALELNHLDGTAQDGSGGIDQGGAATAIAAHYSADSQGERRAATARKVAGIMNTLEGIGAFRRIDPEDAKDG
jgi:hypothetical protein